MAFYADLHIHSKHSRATSRDCDLEHLAWWARRKGISVVATGDFTHPAWWDEIRTKLVAAEPGLFRLRPEIEREVERRLPGPCRGPVRFLLEVEISTIYKKGERTRKIHHLIYAANLETAGRFRRSLAAIGNISSDGRPILGLDSRDLLEITLASGPDAYLVPAHIWTPWFAVLGSKSGFDAVEDCYGDLAGHIFAVETGLSSDPPMNWRVSGLDKYTLVSNSDAHSPPMLGREACRFETEMDYFAMRRALETGEGFGGTVEFFPEEGKYHLDGHRACGVRFEPAETRGREGRCPVCAKPLTVGVMHRVEDLADRPEGGRPERTSPYRCLVPLPEILGEIHGVGPRTKTVERAVSGLVERLGSELGILERLPLEDVGDSLVAEALSRVRAGDVRREAGYDGEYGVIRLFEPGEIASRTAVATLFDEMAFGEMPAAPVGEGMKSPSSKSASAKSAPSTSASSVPAGEAAAPPEASPPAVPEQGSLFEAAADSGAAPQPRRRGILAALDDAQRAAASHGEGPLLVIAGPGAGKTRTLTHRLAHLVAERGVPPEECLAVTFTRRAAAEMAGRLEALLGSTASRLTVTTFHGLGLLLLRELPSEAGLGRGFRVAGEAECAALAGGRKQLKAICRERRVRFEAGGATPEARAYEEALRTRDLVDFDDLLLVPLCLFAEEPEAAAAVRRRFRWVAVDEYQDVDALQYRLVRHLVPPEGNLSAIGDPDQSIYRFRGADVGFFLRFREDFPKARTVELGRNYRSSPVIVRLAREVIRPASLVPGRRLEAVGGAGAERVVLAEAASEKAEAEGVAHTVERLLGGTSYFSLDSGRVGPGEGRDLSFGDFAVLYRTDAQAAAVAEALGRAGIPYQRRSHAPLSERKTVRALLEELESEEGSCTEGSRTVEGLLGESASRLLARLGGTAEREIELCLELLRPLAARAGDDLEGFRSAVALDAEVDTWDPRAERVSLLTLHAAKGLEFPVVFLVGCEEGLLPLRYAVEQEDIDEERRLFFVGITRAEQRLYLSWARRRSQGGEMVDTRPSRFLQGVEEALLDRRSPDPAATRRKPRQLKLL